VVAANTKNTHETQVRLRFTETLTGAISWQQAFILELAISISNTLTLELVTRNTGTQQFSITQAFHSYFHIGHIRQVQVYGLENTEYVDKLADGSQKLQQGAVTVANAIDRIYTNVNNELVIDDLAFMRKIKITSTNSKTAVVWNPWATLSAHIADLDADDYQRFICVEAGNVGQEIIHIEPDSEYRLRTQFKIIRTE
jgi:glucose-6-phosphate 1-epimerase